MIIRRISAQSSGSLVDFYTRLLKTMHYHDHAGRMLELLRTLERVPNDRIVWACTSHEELLITETDDYQTSRILITPHSDRVSIRYPAPLAQPASGYEAYWACVWFIGETSSSTQAADILLTAIERAPRFRSMPGYSEPAPAYRIPPPAPLPERRALRCISEQQTDLRTFFDKRAAAGLGLFGNSGEEILELIDYPETHAIASQMWVYISDERRGEITCTAADTRAPGVSIEATGRGYRLRHVIEDQRCERAFLEAQAADVRMAAQMLQLAFERVFGTTAMPEQRPECP